MRHLDPNPDVNELLNYNGWRKPPPDVPGPKSRVPRPDFGPDDAGPDDAGWVWFGAGPAVAAVLAWLVWFLVR